MFHFIVFIFIHIYNNDLENKTKYNLQRNNIFCVESANLTGGTLGIKIYFGMNQYAGNINFLIFSRFGIYAANIQLLSNNRIGSKFITKIIGESEDTATINTSIVDDKLEITIRSNQGWNHFTVIFSHSNGNSLYSRAETF